MVVRTGKGLAMITGCVHPGIVNIARTAKEQLNERIFLVIGGSHLGEFPDPEVKEIIAGLTELGVEQAAPCHCSGERTRELFAQEYGENYIANGVGKTIEI